MSWKYSTASSYIPRDSPSNRESSQTKHNFLNSKLGSSGLDSRRIGWSPSSKSGDSVKFHRNLLETVEHSPVWSRTSPAESPACVQRLKEKYNLTDEPVKRGETKDVGSHKSQKFYGRSYTSLNVEDRPTTDTSSNFSKFRRKLDKPQEIEKITYGPNRFSSSARSLEPPRTLHIPTETSRLPIRTNSNDSSPSSLHSGDRSPRTTDGQDVVLTVVTRGTSPTPTVSAVFLRSKRSDYGIEKRITRSRKKPEMVHKEIQTDKEEHLFSKYSAYGETNIRTKTWSPYSDKYSTGSSYGSKYSSRTGYGSPGTDCRRSVSREDKEDATTPDSPLKSPVGKPPHVKEVDKKLYLPKSPTSNFRLPLKLDGGKTDSNKSPNSPNYPTSPLQCKVTNTEVSRVVGKTTENQSPKLTIEDCSDIMQAIADVSSASESSEEESTSEDESDEKPTCGMTIKKSITNFLQNIPNGPKESQTRSNLLQRTNTSQKINFKRIESGEKAWWMDNVDKDYEGVPKVKSTRSLVSPEYQNTGNFLSPNFSTSSRHWGNSNDRLKNNIDDDRECRSPREEKPKSVEDCNGFTNSVNGEQQGSFINNQSVVNSFPTDSDSMKFNLKIDQTFNDSGRRFLGDFPRECSVKDVHQKLSNGLGSPVEDKNHLDPNGMSGLISKAKAELTKAKPDVRKSSSREMSPLVTDPKSEIDLYWKELADSVSRPLRLCDLDFTDLNSDDETDILGTTKMNGEVPVPPPMLILPTPPAMAQLKPPGVPAPPAGFGPPSLRNFKAPTPPAPPQIVKIKKTVKLFWKEVKDESAIVKSKAPDVGGQIWDELVKVKVDTQKLEHLFESRAKDLSSKKQQDQMKNKEIIVLDPKRSNAINIGMTKLPPPRAIRTAILKMDSTVVNKEGIEKVLTMLPTEEEKVRILEAQNANPDIPLGSAEQFLLTLASISQLEARLRLWAFKLDFEMSEKEICEPLMDLKQGMEVLRVNKTFRSILSTLLSIGNFLNGCDAKGFQIEYLSKVPEVKDTVHKHSLLHHLCIIVMEKFPESTDLYSEIGAVTRASKVDFDELSANIKKLEEDCKLSWNYLKIIAKHEGHTAMKVRMSDFLADCAERIIVLGVVHKRIMSRFQKFVYWLGVPMNRISTMRPNEIFKIISEFALEFRTTRDRVLQQIKKINREKSRSRGYLAFDANDTVGVKMNSKEAKDDAKLKQLLGKDLNHSENMNMPTWRRHRKDARNILQETNQNEVEILETLIKTANQRSGLKERRRSRLHGKCCKIICPLDLKDAT